MSQTNPEIVKAIHQVVDLGKTLEHIHLMGLQAHDYSNLEVLVGELTSILDNVGLAKYWVEFHNNVGQFTPIPEDPQPTLQE
ncbi:hypothetical protein Q5H92_14580 [Hymenobacter sp. M29]|uniref:Uncharacterized protein n=1 Tax=Hymenobacter mellowenesis TaxID=3063995 RepID=A0ABT9ADG7_9BACT|nr:hypothetical protein [Hymenobacter sp. M29]MDO7847593.1 hypothetical protein [Hymenobacter sp. M29]